MKFIESNSFFYTLVSLVIISGLLSILWLTLTAHAVGSLLRNDRYLFSVFVIISSMILCYIFSIKRRAILALLFSAPSVIAVIYIIYLIVSTIVGNVDFGWGVS